MRKPVLFTCLGLFVICLCLVAAGQIAISTVGHRNPPVVSEPAWDSPQTRELAQRACFDCHSNETKWPWYTHVPPFSLLILNDVAGGRDHLNFSDWQTGRQEGRALRELNETVTEGEMPPANYLMMHPESKLTPAETALLVQGLSKTLTGQ